MLLFLWPPPPPLISLHTLHKRDFLHFWLCYLNSKQNVWYYRLPKFLKVTKKRDDKLYPTHKETVTTVNSINRQSQKYVWNLSFTMCDKNSIQFPVGLACGRWRSVHYRNKVHLFKWYLWVWGSLNRVTAMNEWFIKKKQKKGLLWNDPKSDLFTPHVICQY